MLFHFATVLAFLILALIFVFVALTAGSLLRAKIVDQEKSTIYECGERPIGEAWFNFNPRFYILALTFIVFDVEIALTIPVFVVFRKWITEHRGVSAFVEIAVFILILMLALAYVWRNRDIRWIKKLGHASPLKEDERKYYYY
ncbi:MAG: NADH-quinone oxidoreductase subunit A [Thermodesulfobacteriota bacterium]